MPAGGISVIVPTPRNAGLAFHFDCGVIVPTASKLSCAAWLPTSCVPEFVKMVTWFRSPEMTLISISCDS